LTTEFYQRVGRDPQLRLLYHRDLATPSEHLALFLAELLGGPELYSFARGRPRMRKRHQRFTIGPAERDAWLECMRGALDVVVEDGALRDELWHMLHVAAASLVNSPVGGRRLRRTETDASNPLAGRFG